MLNRFRRELGLILGWLIFPVVPVVLEDFYFNAGNGGGLDPRVWGWLTWLIMLGPLVGYGFLAGATIRVPDEDLTSRRTWRRVLGRRAVWVAIGPWWGALVCGGLIFGLLFLDRHGLGVFDWANRIGQSYQGTWGYWLVSWALSIVLLLLFAYSWIWPACSALRRAAPRRAVEAITRPGNRDGRDLRRLALRQFLGGDHGVAKLLLRSAHRQANPHRREPVRDERLCLDRDVW